MKKKVKFICIFQQYDIKVRYVEIIQKGEENEKGITFGIINHYIILDSLTNSRKIYNTYIFE